MTKLSQWDKLRKVINGVRTGHVMTDEAILEISAIFGVVPTGGLRARHSEISDIAPTEGISDEEANRRASAFEAKWRNKSTEEFLATIPETVPVDEPYKDYELRSADRSGISDEEANRRATAFVDRLSKGDKLRMARIVPEAVKEAVIVSEYPTRREMVKAHNADALVDEWQRYAHNRKTAFADQLLSMEDFRLYITYWYGTDILA